MPAYLRSERVWAEQFLLEAWPAGVELVPPLERADGSAVGSYFRHNKYGAIRVGDWVVEHYGIVPMNEFRYPLYQECFRG